MNAIAQRLGLSLLAIVCGTMLVRAEEVGSKVYMGGMKSCVMVLNLDTGGQGSGSVVNVRDGHVLTNWHVAQQGADVIVVFPIWEKGRPVVETATYKAQARKIGHLGKVVASDQKVDLAVIKLAEPAKAPMGTEPVKFAADSPLAGGKIYSIGNPAASEALWIYTPGDVRQVYKKSWKSGVNGRIVGEHESRIIEANSLTNSGDSGGPCFNDRCEQVGVTQGGVRSSVAQGFSYFIDVSEVRTFLRSKKIAFSQAEVANNQSPNKEDPMPTTEALVNPPSKEALNIKAATEELARQEKAAVGMLNLIRPLAKDPDKQAFAVDKLKQIVRLYPKTEAAKEAGELLKKIQ